LSNRGSGKPKIFVGGGKRQIIWCLKKKKRGEKKNGQNEIAESRTGKIKGKMGTGPIMGRSKRTNLGRVYDKKKRSKIQQNKQ